METAYPILIVDDDEAIREFVAMALQDEGYSVALSGDGASALEFLAQSRPSLIILDMRMPIVDGWMFLQAYQDFPEPRAPVIAVSANHRAVAGATGDVVNFIAKPFDLNDLLELVEKYTRSNAGIGGGGTA